MIMIGRSKIGSKIWIWACPKKGRAFVSIFLPEGKSKKDFHYNPSRNLGRYYEFG